MEPSAAGEAGWVAALARYKDPRRASSYGVPDAWSSSLFSSSRPKLVHGVRSVPAQRTTSLPVVDQLDCDTALLAAHARGMQWANEAVHDVSHGPSVGQKLSHELGARYSLPMRTTVYKDKATQTEPYSTAQDVCDLSSSSRRTVLDMSMYGAAIDRSMYPLDFTSTSRWGHGDESAEMAQGDGAAAVRLPASPNAPPPAWPGTTNRPVSLPGAQPSAAPLPSPGGPSPPTAVYWGPAPWPQESRTVSDPASAVLPSGVPRGVPYGATAWASIPVVPSSSLVAVPKSARHASMPTWRAPHAGAQRVASPFLPYRVLGEPGWTDGSVPRTSAPPPTLSALDQRRTQSWMPPWAPVAEDVPAPPSPSLSPVSEETFGIAV